MSSDTADKTAAAAARHAGQEPVVIKYDEKQLDIEARGRQLTEAVEVRELQWIDGTADADLDSASRWKTLSICRRYPVQGMLCSMASVQAQG